MTADFQNRAHYFRRAMIAIEGFDDACDVEDVGSRLGAALSSFGYESYVFATAFTPARPALANRKLLMRWPSEWFQQYEHEQFGRYDAVSEGFRALKTAFRWSEIPIRTAQARRVMDVAAFDHGLRFGLCVPLYCLSGYEAGASMGGQEVDGSNDAQFAIELISTFAFAKFSRVRSSGRPLLTPRQREILQWVAAGKTAWEIGTILRISTDAVNKITTAAMQRLGAHSRTQAVAEALRRQEIRF